MSTLGTILKDHWEWRDRIAKLSVFELKKKSRGAVLSWAWFFIKPAMYIFCFWFALEVGLRVGRSTGGDAPYILWLCAGLIPWFFMQDMLNQGCDVLHRYPYLVNKIKFPISCISSIYTGATLIVHFFLVIVLFIMYFANGQPLDIHLLQVPLIMLIMFVFWTMFSIMFSQLSALSKDVANLMQAMSTPFFWLSGVIFDVSQIPIDWIQWILDFNPVTFFCVAYRDAFYNRIWFWEDVHALVCFGIVFVGTAILMVLIYSKFHEEVADVL